MYDEPNAKRTRSLTEVDSSTVQRYLMGTCLKNCADVKQEDPNNCFKTPSYEPMKSRPSAYVTTNWWKRAITTKR